MRTQFYRFGFFVILASMVMTVTTGKALAHVHKGLLLNDLRMVQLNHLELAGSDKLVGLHGLLLEKLPLDLNKIQDLDREGLSSLLLK